MLKCLMMPATTVTTHKSHKSNKISTVLFERRSVLLLSIAVSLYWSGIYIYAPILPVYAQHLGASLSVVGIIVAAYALPQLVFRIPLGLWSDALGRRKPIVIGGVAMVSIGAIGLVLATNPWFIALSRVAVGIAAASWVDLTVYFVSFYQHENTQKAVGLLNFLGGGAQLVATVCGGAITDAWGARFTFFGAAILGLLALLAFLFTHETREARSGGISRDGFKKIVTRPLLLVVSVMAIMLFFAQFSGLWGFTPVYAASIGANSTQLGILTMLTMGASMVAALVTAPIVKRFGYAYTIIFASILLGGALAVVPFIHSLLILDAAQLINGAGRGILATALMSLSIYAVAPQQQATAMGFYQATYAIGMFLGPLISGVLADKYGLAIIFYLSGGVCLIITGMAFLRVLPKQ